MKFHQYLKIKEDHRDLAKDYSNILKDVPQDPNHHSEGNVLIHSRLVRKAIPRAITELNQLKNNSELSYSLANIDFNVSPEENEILVLTAWLHDIGKATATTIGGQPWTQPGATGRIQAISHEQPEHYLPQLEKLKNVAPPKIVDLYVKNQELINFLIEHHMDFTSGAFSKGFIAKYFQNGQVKNVQEMKLLLILMWADKMGRKPEETIAASIKKNANALQNSVDKSKAKYASFINQNKPFSGKPEDFARMLSNKPMDRNVKIQALKGKFPTLSDEEITQLIPESFRTFFENNEPHVIPADIPVDNNVKTLAHVLKQNDPNAEVYVVGGAVRDYLYHNFHGQPGTQYKPKDVDLTTNLSEEEILEKLRSNLAQQHGIRVSEKESVDTFGVVFASVKGSETYEIAPFRKDIGVTDGRRPDHTERGTIHDDAMRRDLTMNNLYYDFDKKVILDFNQDGQGINDIKNKVARPVGDPHHRFNEDKLRILRFVRFFSRFNDGNIKDKIDPQTAAAVNHFSDLKANGITPERIQMEFLAGVKQSLNTTSYLNNLVELNLIKQVFPGLSVDIQGISHVKNNKNIKAILAWLLRDNKNALSYLNQLKYPNDISETVQFLINTIKFGPENALHVVQGRDRYLIGAGNKQFSPQEIAAKNQEISSSMQKDLNDFAQIVGDPTLANKLIHLSNYQAPNIDGLDLMKQGFQGAAIGNEKRRQTTNHYQQSFSDYLKTKQQ